MITGPGFEPFVASERFRSEWTSSALKGIIGWTPVEIVGRKELKYYFPEFQPRMVKANLNAMNVSWQGAFSPCKSCGQATIAEYRGIKLQQETWTGQDLFLLTNLPDVIATTGFKQLVDDKRLSNIDLVPLGEYVPVFAR